MDGQQQQKQQQPTTTMPPSDHPGVTATTTTAAAKEFADILPKDLKAIIAEVAKSGLTARTKLPWLEDVTTKTGGGESNSFGVPKQILPLFQHRRHHHRKTTSRSFSTGTAAAAVVRHKRPRASSGTGGRIGGGRKTSLSRMRSPYHNNSNNNNNNNIGTATGTCTAVTTATTTATTTLPTPTTTTSLLPSRIVLHHPSQQQQQVDSNNINNMGSNYGRRLVVDTQQQQQQQQRKRAISQQQSGGIGGSSGQQQQFFPSGSEAETDVQSQYEWDSESTSVTSVSELSFDLGRQGRDHWNNVSINNNSNGAGGGPLRKIGGMTERLEDSHVFVGQPKPRSLRDAFRIAVDLTLEAYYHKRGYKPSPAEKRKHSTAIANEARIARVSDGGRYSLSRQSSAVSERELMMQESIISFENGGTAGGVGTAKVALGLSDDEIQKLQKTSFGHRKERIISFLDDPLAVTDSLAHQRAGGGGGQQQPPAQSKEPPFTLQRIAEILDDPERYYYQTHKLCNSLEKLLLVSTTVADFGGWYGGEEESIRSLAEDKDPSRHRSSSVTKLKTREQQVESPSSTKAVIHVNLLKPIKDPEEDEERNEVYDAATRASLRAKFDHTGFDPLRSGGAKAMPDDGRPSSPPPPNHGTAPTIQIPLPSGFLRSHGGSPQGSPTSPDGAGRFPSAFSFQHAAGHGAGTGHTAAARSSPVQNHHGILHAPGSLGSAFCDLPVHQLLQLNHPTAAGLATRCESESSTHAVAATAAERDADMESKSPASSSDPDDSDVSFDDSASDGSDAGQPDSTSTASLAAALHRAQQRLHQQNRILSQIQGDPYTSDRSQPLQAPRSGRPGGPNDRSTDSNDPGRDPL